MENRNWGIAVKMAKKAEVGNGCKGGSCRSRNCMGAGYQEEITERKMAAEMKEMEASRMLKS